MIGIISFVEGGRFQHVVLWQGVINRIELRAIAGLARSHPNGWSSRAACIAFLPALTLGVSESCWGWTYAIRFFPASTLNVPRIDYWRAPENHPRACAFIFRHVFWFAMLMTLFMRYAYQSIATANLATPSVLNTDELTRNSGLFLAGLALWIFSLVRFFLKDGHSAN